MRIFGLIGKNLSHSFSYNFFLKRFKKNNIKDAKYHNFEIEKITDISSILNKHNIFGLNVTNPYKEQIIPFLDHITDNARMIGAVNTIEFNKNLLIGHNTDFIGFKKSIYPILENRNKALILGNGGSSKAVQYALKQLNVEYKVVSRGSSFNYNKIDKNIMNYYDIIINTTPLGMFPEIKKYPKIPTNLLTKKHLLFDLIYNPKETLFLQHGSDHNCIVKNGLEMLHIQAEESCNIWGV